MSAHSKAPPSVPDADAWVGRVVDGRYRITQLLGEGGMGTVFIAEHLRLHTPVALKVILPEWVGNGEVAARFAREAMASAKIDHPHVASALDYGTLPGGQTYLVMQFVPGMPLADRIEAGAMPWPVACELGSQIADALAAAHAVGIVHRDLKPDNVMVTTQEDGAMRAMVLDFGVARVPTDIAGTPDDAAPNKALTKVGAVIGTPGYMAPEQAVGERVDARADIYALGVVLWEMLAGRALFPQQGLMAILSAQMGEPPARVRAAASDPDIPEALDTMVARMLAYDSKERPADAREVRDVLRTLIGRSTALSLEAVTLEQRARAHAATMISDASGAASPAAAPARSPARWLREHPFARLLASMWVIPLVLGAALGIAYAALAHPEGARPADGPPDVVDSVTSQVRALARGEADLPASLRVDIDRLLEADDREAKDVAARNILAHAPAEEVPAYARALATVIDSSRCPTRREALAELRALDDDRALPALRWLEARPTKGCGAFRQRDCYACVREDVGATLAALEGRAPAP